MITETEAAKHTSYFQQALALWRTKNPQFNDTEFGLFPSKCASDVISAAHTLQMLANEGPVSKGESEIEMLRRTR